MNAIEKLQKMKPNLSNSELGLFYDVTDVGYHEYQQGNVKGITEMVDWMEKEYGPLAKLSVLVKNYVYQVCNGGHDQYFDNGYASRADGGCMTNHDEIEMHEELIELVSKHLDIGLKDKLLAILKDFKIDQDDTCQECMGNGEGPCSDCCGDDEECSTCDGNGWEECFNCGGTGEDSYNEKITVLNSDSLDKSLYEFSDQLIEEIEAFYVNIFEGVTS